MQCKKKDIIAYLKHQNKPISIYRLAKETKTTYPTAYKWVQILSLMGIIEIEEKNGAKLVRLAKRGDEDEERREG